MQSQAQNSAAYHGWSYGHNEHHGAYSIVSSQDTFMHRLASSFAGRPVESRELSLSFAVVKTQQVLGYNCTTLTGRTCRVELVNASLAPGEYRLPLVNANLPAKMYCCQRLEFGSITTTHSLDQYQQQNASMQSGLVCVHSYSRRGVRKARGCVGLLLSLLRRVCSGHYSGNFLYRHV